MAIDFNKPITKDSPLYVDYNLFFLTAIKKRLAIKKFDRNTSSSDEVVCIITDKYKYCQDTIDLMCRIFSDDKWRFSLRNYKYSPTDEKSRIFTFSVQRIR